MDHPRPNVPAPDDLGQNWLEVVRRQVESLQFGAVEITVHDARVVQVEKTKRLRFGKDGVAHTSEFLKAEPGAKTAPAKT
jgi:hypothetical protein